RDASASRRARPPRSGSTASAAGRSPAPPGSATRPRGSAPRPGRPAATAAARVAYAASGSPLPDGAGPAGSAVDHPDQLTGPVPDPPERDPDQRLDHDRLVHLRITVLPIHKGDRHLDHPHPGPDRPPGQVDLEAVAGRG